MHQRPVQARGRCSLCLNFETLQSRLSDPAQLVLHTGGSLSFSDSHKSKRSQLGKKNFPHRSTWLEREDVSSSSEDVVPNILHVVRYGAAPMSFMVSFCNVAQNQTVPSSICYFTFLQEAVCIKAFLVHQRPEKFYLHSNIVDLTRYGEHWQQVYNGKLDDNDNIAAGLK